MPSHSLWFSSSTFMDISKKNISTVPTKERPSWTTHGYQSLETWKIPIRSTDTCPMAMRIGGSQPCTAECMNLTNMILSTRSQTPYQLQANLPHAITSLELVTLVEERQSGSRKGGETCVGVVVAPEVGSHCHHSWNSTTVTHAFFLMCIILLLKNEGGKTEMK